MIKTIRLKIPQWQGGNNPTYSLGSDLLSFLVPKNLEQKEITVPIPEYEEPLGKENGVTAQSIVAENVSETMAIIQEEAPDKIITLGGDCLVSQAPFDYLHGKYGEELGIIWIDAHPDISTPDIFFNEHAMVLGNLLNDGDPVLAEKVQHPFAAKDVLYVGLQKPTADEEVILERLGLDYQVQDQERITPAEIKEWLKEQQFTKVVVHFDLDVLDPKEFRMLYFAEPGVTDYSAEAGKMSLLEVKETMEAIAEQSEIVGLTVAELLPWDVRNLKNLLKDFDIFR
ncbi:arginase [Enterococcus avium]|uniref:arginase family protein n=1 Tax=Enterococcus malodoratus TaxID=71451 RepID=UPI0008CC4EAE|nr:arginase family protein [Enterococcus malodoratus]BBM16589.1 arginase [Enterococcus avium]SET28109.1 arginase [Enterococcus malodoratus]